MGLLSPSAVEQHITIFGKDLICGVPSDQFQSVAKGIAKSAASAMANEGEGASLVHIVDTENNDSTAQFLKTIRANLKYFGLTNVPLFNGEFNSDYDNPDDLHHQDVPRIRLAHQIDPEGKSGVSPRMVEVWGKLGCFVVMSSSQPLDAFMTSSPEELSVAPHPIEVLRDQGRILEITMPDLSHY